MLRAALREGLIFAATFATLAAALGLGAAGAFAVDLARQQAEFGPRDAGALAAALLACGVAALLLRQAR